MDFLQSAIQFLVRYWYVYLLILVVVFFRSPRGKGLWGELEFNLLTKLFLKKRSYHIFKNVIIPEGQGTAQIDHILVSRYGVFVVATQKMRGWIFGGEDQKSWSQKLSQHSTTFQNRLQQNQRHTMALAELIGLDAKKIFSIIVFIGKSTFKTPMPENVTKGMQFIRYVKAHQTEILGEYEVSELVSRIEERRLMPNRKKQKQHVEYLREQHSTLVKNQRSSVGKDIRIQLRIVFACITFAVVFVFVVVPSEVLKDLPGRLNLVIQQYSSSKQQGTSQEPKEYSFSEDQVKSAMEEVIRQKIERPPSANDNSTDQSEPRYQFEIELHSGVKIYTDNAEIGKDMVRYSSRNGLVISLDRDEIKTMRRTPKQTDQ